MDHPAERPLPESTYRLQFHAGFTFQQARAISEYLHALGVTHAYASPYLKARPGSTHGYDIIEHSVLNPEIGTEADYNAWVDSLSAFGMGHILDTVPNHMGVATNDNPWWNDVLENGPASRFGGFFDIAWRASPRPELQDKVLLPFLGEPYGDALEKGQLQLSFENGAFAICYFDRRFPVAAPSYRLILAHRLEELEQQLGADSPALNEFHSILTAARNVPDKTETDPMKVAERSREKEVIKRRLATLTTDSEPVRDFVSRNVAIFNGKPGDARSFDLLDDLLEHQCYRLAYWRVAPDEINYRRFFDINDLAALSMEREDVFEAAHALIFRLLHEGKISGLRIDHPDGLYEPGKYFRWLQERFSGKIGEMREGEAPAEPQVRPRLYVVAEKILAAEEELVEDWAIHGTSGYYFINTLNGLFVDGANEDAFTRIYHELIHDEVRFSEVVYEKKRLILQVSLSSELHMLTHQLDRLAQKNRKSRDFTFNTLRQALREVIACFPVYRTYVESETVREADRRHIEMAIRRATMRNPLLSRRVFSFLRNMLLLQSPETFSAEDRAEQRRFVGKFQQVTAPVTAKGIEDTAFYVYNRLVSLNEVGGEPTRFGLSAEAFHRYNRERQAKWPYALSPLSTHDTKRSEDVRARINVLSEIPDEWRDCVIRWSKLNEAHRKQLEGENVPDANDEYLLYQTLVGAWPLEPYSADEYAAFIPRIQAYMEKALHEAKVHTSWINPNEEYDTMIREFIGRILDENGNRPFLDDFRSFHRRISQYGLLNSLAQTVLRITCPGVPDTYQGTEIWDFSLVDPDNRRPVDYQHRGDMLRELQAAGDGPELASKLMATKEDGRIKLYVTYRALHCRRSQPGLFSSGDYFALPSAGDKAEHLFAFARRCGETWALVAVPRLPLRLTSRVEQGLLGVEVWGNTRLELPEAATGFDWRSVFTGEVLSPTLEQNRPFLGAAELFKHLPVALLVGEKRS